MRAYSYSVSGTGDIPIFTSESALNVLKVLGIPSTQKTINCRLMIVIKENGGGDALFSTTNLVYDGNVVSTLVLEEPFITNIAYDSIGSGNFLLDGTTMIKGTGLVATVTIYME